MLHLQSDTLEKTQLYLLPKALIRLYVAISSHSILACLKRVQILEGTLRKKKFFVHMTFDMLVWWEFIWKVIVSGPECIFGINQQKTIRRRNSGSTSWPLFKLRVREYLQNEKDFFNYNKNFLVSFVFKRLETWTNLVYHKQWNILDNDDSTEKRVKQNR